MPDPSLRDRLAEALREAPVRGTVMRMEVLTELYGPVDALADAAIAVVRPLLDAKDTEIGRLIAFLERGFDTHMQFGVIAADGTIEMLPCADWCYACKLQAALAERDRAMAAVPLVCSDDRHQAKVRGLEELLAETRDEIDRLATDLASYELHDRPPRRPVTDTADISDYEEQPCP